MSGQHLPGFEVPLHRSLTEPILLAGAPRNIAILNGTIAAALGLGLQMWLAGILVWAIGHSLSVFAAFGRHRLTQRESEVVAMVLRGHSSDAIAGALRIAPGTVKIHRKNIYAKLGIGSQAELFCMFLASLSDRRA